MENFIHLHNLQTLFWEQCELYPVSTSRTDPYVLESWDQIVLFLASLPDKIHNKMKRQARFVITLFIRFRSFNTNLYIYIYFLLIY